ncbi:MAG: membrane protein insertase YidC, partial [Bacteroidetes bacterium]
MDRNSIIGIVLITILFAVYFYLFNPAQQQQQQASSPADTSQVNPAATPVPGQATTTPEAAAEPDSVREKRQRDRFSDLYPVSQGKEETVTVKTDRLTVNINTKGGSIRAAYLNEYSTYDSLPVPAIADNSDNQLYFEFPFNNRAIRSYDLYFTPSVTTAEVHGNDSLVVTMEARIDSARSIEQVYVFHGNTYDLGYRIRMKGLKNAFGSAGFYDLQWKSHLPRTELALENMRQKTTVSYRAGKDVEKLKTDNDHQKEKLSSLSWVAYKSQFFTSVLIGEKPFRTANLSMYTPGGEEINRVMDSRLIVDASPTDDFSNNFRFYFGPNEFYTLRSYSLGLEDQMDLGWTIIGWINKGTTYVFKFLERYVSNYGLIIIILAILIRLVILPFSLSSYVSMAKMRIINAAPEIKALDEKHKDDPQKLQMAKMGIYREMGVSMFGGCLPMLFSYPFLIALFFFFPQAVELRHQPFLWAADLSTYDSI